MPSLPTVPALKRWLCNHFGLLVVIFLIFALHSCQTNRIEDVRQETDFKMNQVLLITQQRQQRYQEDTMKVLNEVSKAQIKIGKVESHTINDHSRYEIGNVNVKVEAPNYGTASRTDKSTTSVNKPQLTPKPDHLDASPADRDNP
ncbi:hypothetical protein IFT48_18450 [Pseudomonas fluorescens]|uniref:hypothetical protein n=1 Tax=Pseudomonas fluorescens TaxID=294 RepID=UPI001908E3F4|nr:hypothetical protein [Pseudomonas fluorescens]MBD8091980.1 hypothetical protein [Pseudomonas fluorescens]MBD8718263.1 hypothetical protein [Pseudomonas fluorescens]